MQAVSGGTRINCQTRYMDSESQGSERHSAEEGWEGLKGMRQAGLGLGRRGEGWAAGERERDLGNSCSALKEVQVFNTVLRNPVVNLTCTSLTTAFGYKGHYWNN